MQEMIPPHKSATWMHVLVRSFEKYFLHILCNQKRQRTFHLLNVNVYGITLKYSAIQLQSTVNGPNGVNGQVAQCPVVEELKSETGLSLCLLKMVALNVQDMIPLCKSATWMHVSSNNLRAFTFFPISHVWVFRVFPLVLERQDNCLEKGF